jgi:hypothetical protein
VITSSEKQKIKNRIHMEYCCSLLNHGNWNYYSYWFMMWVIVCELFEVFWALAKRDFQGPHSVFIELAQVAACCQKMMVQILRRGEGDENE